MAASKSPQYRTSLHFEDGASYTWLEREGPGVEGQWTITPEEREQGLTSPLFEIVDTIGDALGRSLIKAHGPILHVQVKLVGRDADTQLYLALNDIEEDVEYQVRIAEYPQNRLGVCLAKDPIAQSLVKLLRLAPNADAICEKQLIRWLEGLKKGEMLDRTEAVCALLFAMTAAPTDLGRQVRFEFAGSDYAELSSIRMLAKTLSVVGGEFKVDGRIVEI